MTGKQEQKRPFFSPALGACVGIFLVICLVCGLVLARREGPCVAEITVNGVLWKEIDLQTAEDQTLSPKEGVEIVIENHAIFFAASPCKEQRCVRAGKLTKPGQSAFCLPEEVLIVLRGAEDDRIDGVL